MKPIRLSPPKRRVALLAALLGAASLAAGAGATPASAAFGLQTFSFEPVDQNGAPYTQAGGHPYAMTTTLAFNTTTNSSGTTVPDEDVKDVEVNLPRGFVVNPQAVAQCLPQRFLEDPAFGCPPSSQVGVVTLTLIQQLGLGLSTASFPVYNLVPPKGEPARLGFDVVFVQQNVRGNVNPTDYSLTASLPDIPQAVLLFGSSLTLWGVPADSSHDAQRGVCLAGQATSCPSGASPRPFLTNPTECGGNPLSMSVSVDSWQHPGDFKTYTSSAPPMTGCEHLPFAPSISVQPDTSVADSPTGLNVDLQVPQNENPSGLAEANLRDTTVTLPAGVSVNPAAATGLASCSPAQIGLGASGEPTCPDAAKVGSVEVDSPLLPDPLTGAVYIAQQNDNPFGSLLAIYVTAEADGVRIKLAGHVSADPVTGQLTTTFENNPQLPFSDFKLDFFGGPRAALATPESCGTYTTDSLFSPWSATPAVAVADSFSLGSGCVSGFSPSFSAGTENAQAGAFTPFVLSFQRSDTDQDLSGLTVKLPEGLLAKLAGVQECSEARFAAAAASSGAAEQASPSCPAGAQVGTVTTGAGAGSQPLFVGGKAYLTGPYKGAPYGLAVIVPAVAGPYDLGTVVVRQALYVDPNDSQVTDVSDPLPTILQGIPIRMRRVDVTIDRPDFTFNPTSCEPLNVTGTLASLAGVNVPVSSRFQVAGCASLTFRPAFSASTRGMTSKAGGASLTVKVSQQPGEANIHKVDLTLPKVLPARLTTLQQACTEAQFNLNPAGCPTGSFIGTAKAITPVLSVPLTGPAILVSHGGAAFPDVMFILQADEHGGTVRIDLDGHTDIKQGITYSRFETVPDAPISSFETVLPQGPHSALAATGDLCTSSLAMPTQLTGQNGATLDQTTKIAVTGCPRTKSLTRAQKLARALKACHKKPKGAKRKACERAARKKYGPPAKKTKKAKAGR